MDCIREAENRLWYYRDLVRSVDYAREQIGILAGKGAPKGITAVSMDPTGIRASKPHDTLSIMYQLQRWTEIRDKTSEEIDKIDAILAEIIQEPGCERYADILKMWYVEKMAKEDIADDLGYNQRRSVYELCNKAIRKFAIRLFGLEALRAI